MGVFRLGLALACLSWGCGYRLARLDGAASGQGQPMAWVEHEIYVAPVVEEVPAGIGPVLRRELVRTLSAEGVAVSSRPRGAPVLHLRVVENENTRNNNLDVLREAFEIEGELVASDGTVLWGPIELGEQEQFSEAPVEGAKSFRTDRALFAEGQRAAYLQRIAERLSRALLRKLQDDHLAQVVESSTTDEAAPPEVPGEAESTTTP